MVQMIDIVRKPALDVMKWIERENIGFGPRPLSNSVDQTDDFVKFVEIGPPDTDDRMIYSLLQSKFR